MKLIVTTLLLLVAVIAPGYAQRSCFVCTNCAQPFERNSYLVQQCTAANSIPNFNMLELTSAPPETTTSPGTTTDPNLTTTVPTNPTLPTTLDPNLTPPVPTDPTLPTVPTNPTLPTTLDPNLTPPVPTDPTLPTVPTDPTLPPPIPTTTTAAPDPTLPPPIPTTTAPSDTTLPTTTAAPENLQCFRIERILNNERQVNRGCVQWDSNKDITCGGLDGERDTCRICNENECNAGIKAITSFGTILAALLIVLKFY